MSIGIDIVQVSRMKLEDKFVSKFLHNDEKKLLNKFENDNSKLEFLAGRWAAKEALFKAYNHSLNWNEINIIYKKGKPIFENKVLINYQLSISHEREYAVAFVMENKIS